MTVNRNKILDYLILGARVLIAWTLIRYGWSKLIGNQFGLSPDELNTPIQNLSLFKISWYLFDHEPFKTFVGISQMATGLLLLYNRTLLIGALMAIPLLLNILIIDISFIKIPGFYWRLSYYLFLIFVIIWHYRELLNPAVKKISEGSTTRFEYPLWPYFILPLVALGLEIFGVFPKMLTGLVTNPDETISAFGNIPELIIDAVK